MNTNPSQFLNFVYLKRFNNIHLFLFKIKISLAHYRTKSSNELFPLFGVHFLSYVHLSHLFSRTTGTNWTKLGCVLLLGWSNLLKLVSGDLALHPRWLPIQNIKAIFKWITHPSLSTVVLYDIPWMVLF